MYREDMSTNFEPFTVLGFNGWATTTKKAKKERGKSN